MQPASPPSPGSRAIGLRRPRSDAYRVYAMLFIIVGHTEMAVGPTSDDVVYAIQLVLNIAGRVAVPLFLMLAGHQLGPRLARHDGVVANVGPYVRRLFVMLAMASLLYWAFDAARLVRGRGLAAGLAAFVARDFSDPIALVLYGARPHLWFLVSLMLTVALAAWALARMQVRTVAIAAVLLYGSGLALGPYGHVVGVHLPHVGPVWSVLFLQAPLFFVLGMLLSSDLGTRQSAIGWGLLLGGGALHAFEVWWISGMSGTLPFFLPMLAGTVPFALGAGFLALRGGATPLDRLTARAAVFVPAVYLNHGLFLELYRPPRGLFDEAFVRVALPLVTALSAFGAAWLVVRLRARWKRSAGARGKVADSSLGA